MSSSSSNVSMQMAHESPGLVRSSGVTVACLSTVLVVVWTSSNPLCSSTVDDRTPFSVALKSPPKAFVDGEIVISPAATSEAAVPGLVLAVLTECFVPVGDDGMAASIFLILPARLGGAVTPPEVGSPSLARDATQFLYFVNGKRSLTSSIDISFFSLLRRCGRVGMFSRLIGSTSSPFRIARLRALYRKQYLTPTIIL